MSARPDVGLHCHIERARGRKGEVKDAFAYTRSKSCVRSAEYYREQRVAIGDELQQIEPMRGCLCPSAVHCVALKRLLLRLVPRAVDDGRDPHLVARG